MVSEKHKIKYKKILNQKEKFKESYSNNMMNCPFPDCEEVKYIDRTYERKFFRCGRNHKFCTVCKICHDDTKTCNINVN